MTTTLAVVRRHRLDLDDDGLTTALRELGRGEELSAWLHNLLRQATLPPPPWPGNDDIEPLATVAAIH